MNESCMNCRYRNRSSLENPCATGIYQLQYGRQCLEYKPLRHWQTIVDKIRTAMYNWREA